MRPSLTASFFCAAHVLGDFDAISGEAISLSLAHDLHPELLFPPHGTTRALHVYCAPRTWVQPRTCDPVSVCAVLGVLLVAVSVAAKANPQPAGASVAVCSELSERREWLHAEIARLHAETALVEAELFLLCTERSNQSDVGLPPLLAEPSHSPGGTADETTGMQQIAPQTALRVPAPARGSGKDEIAYAVHCWAPNSTFTDPSCNCLREAAHPKLGSRPTIRIIVGSWYGPPSLLLGLRSNDLVVGLVLGYRAQVRRGCGLIFAQDRDRGASWLAGAPDFGR